MPIVPNFRRSLSAIAICAVLGAGSLHAADPLVPAAPASVLAPKPVTELTAEILYKTLLAEIAAARGQVDLAAYVYLDLARSTQDARMAKRATELAMRSGQAAYTGEAAKLWAALEPRSTSALQALALAMSGEYAKLEDMEPALRRMLESETQPTGVFVLQLPSLLVRYPDKAAALALVERLTQPHLDIPESHFVRAVMALAAEDRVKAEREAQKALDMRADWELAARVKAQAAPPARQTQAMEELGRFGKHYPQAKGAREDYGRWLALQGRKAEAAEIYTRLLADYPNDDDIAFGQVVMLVQSGEAAKAETLLRRLVEHGYRDTDLLRMQLGQVLETSSRPDEAVAQYAAVKPGKQFVLSRARAAQIRAGQGQLDQANALLAEAIAQSPADVVELTLAQAALLRQGKHYAEALVLLEKLMLNKPDDHELLYESAMLADQLKRYEQMEKWLRRLIVVRPDNASAFNALGYSFADRNLRLPEADQLLTQALKLEPDNAAIIDSMGWLRFRQGQYDAAVTLLRKAYDKQADADIAAHLGETLWQQGKRDEARKLLQEARKTSPDNEALSEVINRLLK